MRVSIPGLPGVYYDTDSGSTAIGVASTAVGRKAPKPQGYAVQLLPYLWSFDVDLREVPNDHPIQYLHPEGAQSLGELSPERGVRQAGNELESVLRFVWSVNQEVESTANQLIGRGTEADGVTIEIEDGQVSVGGDELATDEFDLEESAAGATDATGASADAATSVEITEGTNVIEGSGAAGDPEPADEADAEAEADADADTDEGHDLTGDSSDRPDVDENDEPDAGGDVFGATEEPPADEEFDSDTDAAFGTDDESIVADDDTDESDPDES